MPTLKDLLEKIISELPRHCYREVINHFRKFEKVGRASNSIHVEIKYKDSTQSIWVQRNEISIARFEELFKKAISAKGFFDMPIMPFTKVVIHITGSYRDGKVFVGCGILRIEMVFRIRNESVHSIKIERSEHWRKEPQF